MASVLFRILLYLEFVYIRYCIYWCTETSLWTINSGLVNKCMCTGLYRMYFWFHRGCGSNICGVQLEELCQGYQSSNKNQSHLNTSCRSTVYLCIGNKRPGFYTALKNRRSSHTM